MRLSCCDAMLCVVAGIDDVVEKQAWSIKSESKVALLALAAFGECTGRRVFAAIKVYWDWRRPGTRRRELYILLASGATLEHSHSEVVSAQH